MPQTATRNPRAVESIEALHSFLERIFGRVQEGFTQLGSGISALPDNGPLGVSPRDAAKILLELSPGADVRDLTDDTAGTLTRFLAGIGLFPGVALAGKTGKTAGKAIKRLPSSEVITAFQRRMDELMDLGPIEEATRQARALFRRALETRNETAIDTAKSSLQTLKRRVPPEQVGGLNTALERLETARQSITRFSEKAVKAQGKARTNAAGEEAALLRSKGSERAFQDRAGAFETEEEFLARLREVLRRREGQSGLTNSRILEATSEQARAGFKPKMEEIRRVIPGPLGRNPNEEVPLIARLLDDLLKGRLE